MRLAPLVLAAIVFTVPISTSAQYDFDDFLQAVESGQSKTAASEAQSPRLAQLPDGPAPSVMIDGGVAQPLPVPVQSDPSQVNFPEVFQQECDDRGLAQPVASCSHGCKSCGRAPYGQECAAMPYQVPNLPAPSTLRGYFNASPCIANVWDGYSCEAAAACVKKQQKLMGTYGSAIGCRKQKCD